MTAFPQIDDIALLLEKIALEYRNDVPHGWAPRILASGGVPYATLFDAFHNMYESQVSLTHSCDHSVIMVWPDTTVQCSRSGAVPVVGHCSSHLRLAC